MQIVPNTLTHERVVAFVDYPQHHSWPTVALVLGRNLRYHYPIERE